jgi:cob(I)alamin adenosyltransferase
MNVIITGRYCPPALLDLADTASDSQMVKHAYEQGVIAQRGMEC